MAPAALVVGRFLVLCSRLFRFRCLFDRVCARCRRHYSREAFFSPSKMVAARDAIGLASADTVCPYPPGTLIFMLRFSVLLSLLCLGVSLKLTPDTARILDSVRDEQFMICGGEIKAVKCKTTCGRRTNSYTNHTTIT